MAIHAHSTTAPAPHRALLLRVCASVTDGIGRTLDRMAEGRAKPARDARGRFCRRSDLAVLSPADDADLDAAVRALFAGIDAGRAEPLLPAGVVLSEETTRGMPKSGDTPDAVRADLDALIAETTLLPAPAPLPSLTAALSRRRAIFGLVAVDEPDTAAEARAIHARRDLYQALEWGFAFLDAFDLGPAALDVVDGAIAALDGLDAPDEDCEPYLAGVGHFASGPNAQAIDAEDDSDELEGTALESHGCGFVRAGPDDSEDDELDDDRDPEPVAWVFGPNRREVAHA